MYVRSRPRRLAAVALALLTTAAVAAQPAAAGSTPGNPQVLQINPTTGAQKVIAGGSPWTTLGGIAVGSDGTLYVANQGPAGPSPQGAGIYSLTAPAYAITPVATTAPTAYPTGLVAGASTLYSLDGTSVIGIGTTPPYTQQVLSPGPLYQQYGVQPVAGALSGTTLYTTAWSSCDSAEGGGAYVIAVNTATGAQTMVKNLGCASLGGIAVEQAGTLLIAEPSTNTVTGGPSAPAQIVRLNPATGAVTTLSSGGSLKTPQGIAIDPAGDLYVADSTSGVIAVSASTGQQSPVTSGGSLGGATGIALRASGSTMSLYVTEAGVPPTVRASAARSQRWSASGISFAAQCNRTCTVAYDAAISIRGATGFSQDAAFHTVTGRRALRIKLPEQVNRRISRALRQGRRVTVRLTITPQDPRTAAPGASTRLTVRLTR
jgi:hypothetical protein